MKDLAIPEVQELPQIVRNDHLLKAGNVANAKQETGNCQIVSNRKYDREDVLLKPCAVKSRRRPETATKLNLSDISGIV
jgi:hypothetical protein